MIYAALAFAALALPNANVEFDSWKRAHNKSYSSAAEEAEALLAWESNDAIIKEHNAKGLSYWLGHNEFSDLTWEKFNAFYMSSSSALYLNRAPINSQRVFVQPAETVDTVESAPDSKDWVTDGAVTDIKNQGRCGSCWAFSAIGAVEGAFEIASGKLTSLSEQSLVSCDKGQDHGCQGGLMDNAFEFIASKNGIPTEDDYPYTSGEGQTGTCDAAKAAKKAVTVTGHKDVPQGDEDALLEAAGKQPVSIAIEADKSAFQLYKGGVLDSALCGKRLDHGVLLVGYGNDADSGKDFWKVKNSWGASWGEEGYIRMVRGKNMCGIAQSASYPTGAKAASPSPPSPGPSPPGPSPPAGKTHYGDPKDGCLQDELEISIKGVSGDFCSPKCSLFKPCPSDLPAGVTAGPQCALQDAASGAKYCALICSPSTDEESLRAGDAQCGTNASCKSISGAGICTYDK